MKFTLFNKISKWWYKKTWYLPYYGVSTYIPGYYTKNHCLMCHAYVKCSDMDGYPICPGKNYCPCKVNERLVC